MTLPAANREALRKLAARRGILELEIGAAVATLIRDFKNETGVNVVGLSVDIEIHESFCDRRVDVGRVTADLELERQ